MITMEIAIDLIKQLNNRTLKNSQRVKNILKYSKIIILFRLDDVRKSIDYDNNC